MSGMGTGHHNLSAQTLPKSTGAVNDFADVLTPQEEAAIAGLSRELLAKTGVAAVVVTIESTDGMDIAEYANRLYREWGIGKAGVDEGLLILNAVKDRNVRIEVGYGLEGTIPDVLAGRIVRQVIIPSLKNGQYGAGLGRGLAAAAGIIAEEKGVTITGTRPANTRPTRQKRGFSVGSLLMMLMFFLFFGRRGRGGLLPALLFGSMFMPRGGYRGSSGFGGGFGGGQGFSGSFGGFGGGLGGGGGAGGSY